LPATSGVVFVATRLAAVGVGAACVTVVATFEVDVAVGVGAACVTVVATFGVGAACVTVVATFGVVVACVTVVATFEVDVAVGVGVGVAADCALCPDFRSMRAVLELGLTTTVPY